MSIQEKFNYLKTLYDGVNSNFGNFGKVIITGSWAVYLQAKEYNKSHDLKINLEEIDPHDVDFLINMEKPKNNISIAKINSVTINDFEYTTQDNDPANGMTFKSDKDVLIKEFDIIVPLKTITTFDTIENYYCLKKDNLLNFYKDIEIDVLTLGKTPEEACNKLKRHYAKLEILHKLVPQQPPNKLSPKRSLFSDENDENDNPATLGFEDLKPQLPSLPETPPTKVARRLFGGNNETFKRYKIIRK